MPRKLRSKAELTATKVSLAMSRPRRSGSGAQAPGMPTNFSEAPPTGTKQSLKLTMKMPSSKLREVTTSSPPTKRGAGRSGFQPGEIVEGPRSNRNKRPIVESESEEDEDEDDVEGEGEDEDDADEDDVEDEDEDPMDVDEEQDAEEDEGDEDAEGEDDDYSAAGMPARPEPVPSKAPKSAPRSAVGSLPPQRGARQAPSVTVTPASRTSTAKPKSSLSKEISNTSTVSDEDLSELDSEGGDEDAEGEDLEDDPTLENDAEEDDGLSGDSDEEGIVGSRASTPDVSKMTKRQRGRVENLMGNDFLQLPMEPQIKKHLTDEEKNMRRAEMARRRKNLSEKRNEEEKRDTINRLLKSSAPKRRGKISAAEVAAASVSGAGDVTDEEGEVEAAAERPDPVFTRWVGTRDGCRLGVPIEWEGAGAGSVFGAAGWKRPTEEVES